MRIQEGKKKPARCFGESYESGERRVEIHYLSVTEAFTPSGAGTDPAVDSTVMAM